MSFGSSVSQESCVAGDSSVADDNKKIEIGEKKSVGDTASSPSQKQQSNTSKSVGFASTGKVRWFMKKESIIDANF